MPFGGAAIDALGDPLPEATLRACLESDAVLLGAIGGPKWSAPDAKLRPESGLLRLRSELGVYANLGQWLCLQVSLQSRQSSPKY